VSASGASAKALWHSRRPSGAFGRPLNLVVRSPSMYVTPYQPRSRLTRWLYVIALIELLWFPLLYPFVVPHTARAAALMFAIPLAIAGYLSVARLTMVRVALTVTSDLAYRRFVLLLGLGLCGFILVLWWLTWHYFGGDFGRGFIRGEI
jgi:hypothetical protein